MMQESDILLAVSQIIREILKLPNFNVNNQTSAADAVEWDSLSHIKIIVAIEKKFQLRFALSEIHSLKNVGELVALIHRKISASE